MPHGFLLGQCLPAPVSLLVPVPSPALAPLLLMLLLPHFFRAAAGCCLLGPPRRTGLLLFSCPLAMPNVHAFSPPASFPQTLFPRTHVARPPVMQAHPAPLPWRNPLLTFLLPKPLQNNPACAPAVYGAPCPLLPVLFCELSSHPLLPDFGRSLLPRPSTPVSSPPSPSHLPNRRPLTRFTHHSGSLHQASTFSFPLFCSSRLFPAMPCWLPLRSIIGQHIAVRTNMRQVATGMAGYGHKPVDRGPIDSSTICRPQPGCSAER